MDIKELQKNWDNLGKTDPLWATLSHSGKKGNKWQVEEFFKTGVKEIDEVMEYIEKLDIKVQGKRALDFGCAVGRLTQALANYFGEVCGVDIAPSMIELAKKYNRQGNKCKYYLNENTGLKLFNENNFDFIYTNITFLHMEPRYSKAYIKEFLRLLTPNGLLIFWLPSKPVMVNRNGMINLRALILRIVPKKILDVMYRKIKYRNRPKMEGYWIRKKEIVTFLGDNGARVIDIKQKYDSNLLNCQYCVTKE